MLICINAPGFENDLSVHPRKPIRSKETMSHMPLITAAAVAFGWAAACASAAAAFGAWADDADQGRRWRYSRIHTAVKSIWQISELHSLTSGTLDAR
jgi:hypothetical protein